MGLENTPPPECSEGPFVALGLPHDCHLTGTFPGLFLLLLQYHRLLAETIAVGTGSSAGSKRVTEPCGGVASSLQCTALLQLGAMYVQ